MTAPNKKRARRIAADEAHAWARHLRVGNMGAKLVLCMLTQYVNGDGNCFVSVQALCEDCEMSENTVRSRLKYLEEMEIIARTAQFIDELGRRNSDGKGKRTTDEIRLLMGLDEARLEAQLAARERDRSLNVAPQDLKGQLAPQNDPSEEASPPISPSVALQQPFNCVQGMTLEPEPEPEPLSKPLPDGERLRVPDDRLWDEFVRAWQKPMSKYDLTRSCWADIPMERRQEAITAARGYLAYRSKEAKPAAEMAAQNFLRQDAGWPQWLPYAPKAGSGPTSIVSSYPLDSSEGRAIVSVHEIAGLQQFLQSVMIRKGAVNYLRPMTPRLLALASTPPLAQWTELDHKQAAAWDGLIAEHVTVEMRRHLHKGSRAPWPWPPRKDGTLSTAPPPDELMTEQDYADFK